MLDAIPVSIVFQVAISATRLVAALSVADGLKFPPGASAAIRRRANARGPSWTENVEKPPGILLRVG